MDVYTTAGLVLFGSLCLGPALTLALIAAAIAAKLGLDRYTRNMIAQADRKHTRRDDVWDEKTLSQYGQAQQTRMLMYTNACDSLTLLRLAFPEEAPRLVRQVLPDYKLCEPKPDAPVKKGKTA